MEVKIVKIRKLDDIHDRDWEITLENEGKILHNHKHFFEIVERGLAIEPTKPIEKPTVDNITYQEILFPTEDEKLEAIKKKEKEQVNEFRKDVKGLSYYQWKKKYVKEMGDTNK